jgi:hypothetical protein
MEKIIEINLFDVDLKRKKYDFFKTVKIKTKSTPVSGEFIKYINKNKVLYYIFQKQHENGVYEAMSTEEQPPKKIRYIYEEN